MLAVPHSFTLSLEVIYHTEHGTSSMHNEMAVTTNVLFKTQILLFRRCLPYLID